MCVSIALIICFVLGGINIDFIIYCLGADHMHKHVMPQLLFLFDFELAFGNLG